MTLNQTTYFLVGHQRTGTHHLASLLRSTGEVYQYDEVLIPAFDGDRGSEGMFFSYFRARLLEDWSNLLITDYTKVDRLFEGFIQHAVRAVEQKVVGFDVKIDQLACFPRLYGVLPKWNIKVVHLVRRNCLARVVSHQIMNRRVSEGDAELHTRKQGKYRFALDVPATINWMLADQGGNAHVKRVFSGKAGLYYEIAYEDIAGPAMNPVMRDLCSFLGVTADTFSSETVKQNDRPLSETVENLDEVVSELRSRGLSHLLGDDEATARQA